MPRIYELPLGYQFAGSRMPHDLPHSAGVQIGRSRVITLVRLMGIEAIYGRPDTSKSMPGARASPCLLLPFCYAT